MANTTISSMGISMGCMLAMILSWTKNGSIGWAIVHGMWSWVYVIYAVLIQGTRCSG